MSTDPTKDVLSRIDREQPRYLEELETYLRIPSISTDPEYAADVRRCADFLQERFEAAGLESRQLDAGGYPLVYAERIESAELPTVLFYGHYDVQPVDPIDEWKSPPFEPTVVDGNLVCRGATDDKGQSYTHLKAVEAILAERGQLPVNVKFILEGEEESGGEAIERFVHEDAGAVLGADCVIVSDSSMYAPGQPSLIYGLRGMAYMEITVRGPNRDLHSGSYGGGVTNPLNALAEIVAKLKDPETNRVLVPGFYDDVVDLEPWEREQFAALPFEADAYRDAIGVPALVGEEGYTTLERVSARPTCDVNGIFGGYMGSGAKTVLPAWGGAKVSMRLVPNQRWEDVSRRFREYVESIAPAGVSVEVTEVHGGEPIVVSPAGPFMEAAEQALEATWGRKPVMVREGGSIPIVASFAGVLGVPVILMGYGLPDDGLHSPNEKITLSQFYDGIRCTARFLDLAGAAQGTDGG